MPASASTSSVNTTRAKQQRKQPPIWAQSRQALKAENPQQRHEQQQQQPPRLIEGDFEIGHLLLTQNGHERSIRG